jgi:hypothetical protein
MSKDTTRQSIAGFDNLWATINDTHGRWDEGEIDDATAKSECDAAVAEYLATAHLLAAAPELFDAVEHVLIASEDGGDMNDIDWNMLRSAVSRAKGGE